MGIEILERPAGRTPAGVFTLPAGFDSKKLAAKWAQVGNDAEAAVSGREHLIGTPLTADAWAVWKDEKGKPYKVTVKGKVEYVLLFRSREIQDIVNSIYGNVGKERQLAEKLGHTVGGVKVTDPGILGDERLSKTIGRDAETSRGEVEMNPVPSVLRVTNPTIPINSED